jgi:outer membrane protein TolC
MAHVIRSIVFAGLVLWARALGAQDVLTLSQAVQDALTHNRSLRAAESSVREADARVRQTRAAYFPRVSFVESWQRGDQPVFVFSSLLASRQFTAANFAIDSLNSPEPTGFFHGAIALDQVIFDGGRTSASVAAASLQRDVAGLSTDEASATVAVSGVAAYGRVLSAHAALRAADAAIAAAQEDLTRATSRRDAGSLNEADLLAMSVHLADVRQRRIQAEGDETIAKAELNRLMGAPIDRDYTVQEPALADTSTAMTAAALFAEADTNRPDLRRATAMGRLADTALAQARSAWYPQVAAQAQLEANGTQFNERASSWIVGGELRWSYSTGGAQRAERVAALEAMSRARIEREEARAAAQVDILSALRRLESARARQQLAQSAVEQTRESQRIIRDRFEAGVASANDVLRAASAVLDAESQRISALVDAVVSRAALDRAVGRAPSTIRGGL